VNGWFFFLLVIAFVAAIAGGNYAVVVRAKQKFLNWARIRGYRIVSATRRWVRTGPVPATAIAPTSTVALRLEPA